MSLTQHPGGENWKVLGRIAQDGRGADGAGGPRALATREPTAEPTRRPIRDAILLGLKLGQQQRR